MRETDNRKLKGVSRRSAIQSFLALAGAAALPLAAHGEKSTEGLNIEKLEAAGNAGANSID